MNILIRVDASVELGSGHVLRCLTLANMLREQGINVKFACRIEKGNLIKYIEKRDFKVLPLYYEGPFDWKQDKDEMSNILENGQFDILIVDHYEIDQKWEKELSSCVYKIMVIDDLANRKHFCHILLDQNLTEDYLSRYNNLVPETCKLLLGLNNLLLRKEFYLVKKHTFISQVNRVLVFMGGSDPTAETIKILQALEELRLNIHIDVVVGLSNPLRKEIQEMCRKLGVDYHCQVDYLAELMSEADFAIGAGGVSLWERCFIGLPAAVTVVADNQINSTKAAAAQGAIWSLGWYEDVKVQTYKEILVKAYQEPIIVEKLRQTSLRLTELSNDLLHPVVQALLVENIGD